MTSNLTQALRQGAEHALETVAEGWRELRSRAGVQHPGWASAAPVRAGTKHVPIGSKRRSMRQLKGG